MSETNLWGNGWAWLVWTEILEYTEAQTMSERIRSNYNPVWAYVRVPAGNQTPIVPPPATVCSSPHPLTLPDMPSPPLWRMTHCFQSFLDSQPHWLEWAYFSLCAVGLLHPRLISCNATRHIDLSKSPGIQRLNESLGALLELINMNISSRSVTHVCEKKQN